jgi:hypothetical protein
MAPLVSATLTHAKQKREFESAGLWRDPQETVPHFAFNALINRIKIACAAQEVSAMG